MVAALVAFIVTRTAAEGKKSFTVGSTYLHVRPFEVEKLVCQEACMAGVKQSNSYFPDSVVQAE